MRAVGIAILLMLAYALAGPSRAQSSGGDFEVSSHAVAGGGRSVGGDFELHGSIGQSALGALASGGAFELSAGFRRARDSSAPLPDAIFADGFEQP